MTYVDSVLLGFYEQQCRLSALLVAHIPHNTLSTTAFLRQCLIDLLHRLSVSRNAEEGTLIAGNGLGKLCTQSPLPSPNMYTQCLVNKILVFNARHVVT